jgi:hypothetical protein
VVLGFPCDQFAHQEPGDDTQIDEFCKVNYGVTFPLSTKIDVNGKGTHPVFVFLKDRAGGMLGSSAGVWLFTYLKRIGQIDFVIAVLYVVMLSTIGLLMMFESLNTYFKRRRNPDGPRGKLHTHYLVHRLPLKLRFYKSKLYISALLPIGLGFIIGVLSAILGAFSTALHTHLLGTLKYPGDGRYEILYLNLEHWNYNAPNRYVTTAPHLLHAMIDNPQLQVLVCGGWYDAATPHFASDHSVSHLCLYPSLAGRIKTTYYECGHMVYLREADLAKFKADAAAMYTR